VHNRSLRREDATAPAKPALAAALCQARVELFRSRHVLETHAFVVPARYHDLVRGVHVEVCDAAPVGGLGRYALPVLDAPDGDHAIITAADELVCFFGEAQRGEGPLE